ncbi:MAG: DUF3618 domain-containing protein [Pseudoclavibacter sp.]
MSEQNGEATLAKKEDKRNDGQLKADIERTRRELAATLDAIEVKVDPRIRGRELLNSTRHSIQRLKEDNPLLLAGLATGAAVVVAGGITAAVALYRRSR